MAWAFLFFAGLLEVGWAIGLKQSAGFTRLWPSVYTIVCMAASFFLLSLSLRQLPLGTAYAIWTGIGTIGTAIVSILFLQEPRDTARLLCLCLIAAGIVGLKLLGK
jgi:quaternary ammonium compound-resistance protein SugE